MIAMDGGLELERVMGIEPTLSAWEAEVLPLNYTRASLDSRVSRTAFKLRARPKNGPIRAIQARIDFTPVPS